jgi:hypothetical protein
MSEFRANPLLAWYYRSAPFWMHMLTYVVYDMCKMGPLAYIRRRRELNKFYKSFHRES